MHCAMAPAATMRQAQLPPVPQTTLPKPSTAGAPKTGAPPPPADAPQTFAERLPILLQLPPPRPDHKSYGQMADELIPMVLGELNGERTQLPAIPAYALAIMDLSRRIMNVEAAEVVATITRDADTAAQVLKLANSPLYRGVSTTTSLRDAVVRLGRREVGEVAGVVASRFLFNLYSRRVHDTLPRQWYDEHLHAVTTALTVSALSRTLELEDSDYAFSCGLFLDIGRTFTLRAICALILEGRLSKGIEQNVVEHVIDRLHAPTGEAVLMGWSVPESILALCREHHADVPSHAHTQLHHVLRLVAGVSALYMGTPLYAKTVREVEVSGAALGFSEAHIKVVGTIVQSMRIKARTLLGNRPESEEVLTGL
jgi:HD-like signal output (HDOD) protein